MTAKKKLAGAFGGVVAIGATVALTAGTFSYFSDSATVEGGSGTVDSAPWSSNCRDEAFGRRDHLRGARHDRHAAPGSTRASRPALCFQNTGTMAGVLRLKFVPDARKAQAFNDAVRVEFAGLRHLPGVD